MLVIYGLWFPLGKGRLKSTVIDSFSINSFLPVTPLQKTKNKKQKTKKTGTTMEYLGVRHAHNNNSNNNNNNSNNNNFSVTKIILLLITKLTIKS